MPDLPSHASPIYSPWPHLGKQVPDFDLNHGESKSSPPPTFLSPAFTPPSTPGSDTSSRKEPRSVPVDTSSRRPPKLLDKLPDVNCVVRARIPTVTGSEMFLHLYQNSVDCKEHLAIVFGASIRSKSLDAPKPGESEQDRMIRGAYVGRLHPGRTSSRYDPASSKPQNQTTAMPLVDQSIPDAPLVRIHSECYTGETAWSARCDCGEQLDEAARLMSLPSSSGGVIVYLRQEGRGIGLGEKLKAYNLQDLGNDTVQANLLLRHPADARSYGLATAMLLDLGLGGDAGIRLLTNNPDKVRAVEGPNREVIVKERVAMVPLAWKTGGQTGIHSEEVEGRRQGLSYPQTVQGQGGSGQWMDTGSAARLYSVQQNPNAQTHNPPVTTSPTNTHATNKKRRTAPISTPAVASGSRGVANLTPDQLAKKRANDREAQRAIRERTKTQIDGLERRIQELTSQQPYQELQHAIRQKEQVEAENDEIKKRLNNVIGILQPLIAVQPSVGGSGSLDPSFHSRQETIRPAPILTSGFNLGPNTPSYGDPRSATSSTSTYTAATLPPQRHTPPSIALPTFTSQSSAFAPINLLERQHSNVSLLSRRSDEKLDLGYLLHGRQDSQNGREPYGNGRPTILPMHTLSPFQTNNTFDLSTPAHAVPVRNVPATCPLDGLFMDFMAERRQQALEGMSIKELIGPAYPSVTTLLQPSRSQLSHPMSQMFTDMLGTFPDLSTLPEKIAVLYIMFIMMRWQISPTLENYNRLPDWVTPRPSQLITPHPAWVDYLPWPRMREFLVREFPSVPFDEFFIPYTTTLSLNSPYEDRDLLLSMPGTDELSINPVFERHLMDLGNWTLGPAFARAHPRLADTCTIKNDAQRKRHL